MDRLNELFSEPQMLINPAKSCARRKRSETLLLAAYFVRGFLWKRKKA